MISMSAPPMPRSAIIAFVLVATILKVSTPRPPARVSDASSVILPVVRVSSRTAYKIYIYIFVV